MHRFLMSLFFGYIGNWLDINSSLIGLINPDLAVNCGDWWFFPLPRE